MKYDLTERSRQNQIEDNYFSHNLNPNPYGIKTITSQRDLKTKVNIRLPPWAAHFGIGGQRKARNSDLNYDKGHKNH